MGNASSLECEALPNEINYTVQRSRERSVEKNGSRYREDLRPDPENKSLVSAVDGGRRYGIRKACDRYERSRTRKTRDAVEDADACQKDGEKDEGDRGQSRSVVLDKVETVSVNSA